MPPRHRVSQPSILYFGTPVVLVSTVNEDGSSNLAPFSSIWWLGWRAMLGIAQGAKTGQNLARTGECVLNLPSVHEAGAVDRLACLTGVETVPERKKARGYRFEPRKFNAAGLTPVASETIRPQRVLECPVHLEAVVAGRHVLMQDRPDHRGGFEAVELRMTRIHIREDILFEGDADRIDPDKWRPLIMSFQQFYGLAPGRVHGSRLGRIPEHLYRPPSAGTG